jgi:hypothetical protein
MQNYRTLIGSDRLVWRTDNDGLSLHHGQSRKVLAEVVSDQTSPGMFRVKFQDGRISDMANQTWVKDAAIAIALRSLNFRPQETAREAPPVRQNSLPLVGPSTERKRIPSARAEGAE